MSDLLELSGSELLHLSAADSDFYGRYWFPDTCRQPAPSFHKKMDEVLEAGHRYVGFEVFRGGAKTTKLRLFGSKRIAYGISRTVVLVGKSQDHARRSIEWMMHQVEHNRKWASFYRLRKGFKWTTEECEIINDALEIQIRIIALGITGSVRGINVNDYRPDFILLDDPCDEENTATPDQRQKIEDLVFGALLKSLAPESEAPDALMAIAQTPLNESDIIEKIMLDPQWASVRFSCFDDKGESSWPERWTTETLKKDKEAHIKRNQLSLWLREMECTLINTQNSAFLLEWQREYIIRPDHGLVYIGIDPTPPPKDTLKRVVNEKLDDAVIFVILYTNGNIYILDYYIAKSPDPGEFVNKLFAMVLEYRPFLVGVETIMFQRMLKWYIEQEMTRRRQWFNITPVEDKRKKETRIIQSISRYASNRRVYHRPEHTEYCEQYQSYMMNKPGQKDDILDAFSIALDLINPALEGVVIEGEFDVVADDEMPLLEDWRGAP